MFAKNLLDKQLSKPIVDTLIVYLSFHYLLTTITTFVLWNDGDSHRTTIEISAQAEIDKEIQEAIAAAEAGGRRGDGLTGVRDKRRNSANMVVYKLPANVNC